MEALIRRARTAEAAKYTEPDTETWIWSDLHLGHEHSRTVFGRPFQTAAAADEAMMDGWYEHDGRGRNHHLPERRYGRRRGPGLLNQIRPFEIERTAVTLYAAGDPPLLLTHVPLLQVPHGTVVVHGHVHEQESPSPAGTSTSTQERRSIGDRAHLA